MVQIVSAPLCIEILTNFIFGAFSFELKLFDIKLYFTYNLVFDFEKKMKNSLKNYE